MAAKVLTKKIVKFLKTNEFLNIATCSSDMQPNVAPKILLKIDGDCVYLGDYNIDRTWMNIRSNHRVSLSCIDMDTLVGYQLNGVAESIDEGLQQDNLSKLFNKKKLDFSTNRIIEGVRCGKEHRSSEMVFPDRVIVYKIRLEEVIEIQPEGTLERKKL